MFLSSGDAEYWLNHHQNLEVPLKIPVFLKVTEMVSPVTVLLFSCVYFVSFIPHSSLVSSQDQKILIEILGRDVSACPR